jgi:hypothetical protein
MWWCWGVLVMADDRLATLIAEQLLQIKDLEQRLEERENALREILGLLVCCGGPLNDNYLRYSKEQLVIFARILRLVES